MPKELTTEVVRGCLYTWMLIGRLDRRTPPLSSVNLTLMFLLCNNNNKIIIIIIIIIIRRYMSYIQDTVFAVPHRV